MTHIEAIILGVVQGCTEFLPLSSSGHLVIAQKLFGLKEPQLTFDVILHFATVISVVFFFWKDILALKIRDYVLMAVATIPAAVVGVLFKDVIEGIFSSGATLGIEFLVTALCNFAIHAKLKNVEHIPATSVTPSQALTIGTAQAAAIVPALSRSSLTVWAGLMSGLDRESAFRFSFLISIPAILGANVLAVLSILRGGEQLPPLSDVALGAFAAGCVGFASLSLFRYMIRHAQFKWFGWYCVFLGVAVLLWQGGLLPGWT